MMPHMWVMGDLSAAGSIRFARVDPGDLRLDDQKTFPSESFPTFSDALLGYARAGGIDLRTCGCILSLPGPTAGSTIRVARSRWTLSRTGLGGMFGGPLHILNDMAATAWSLVEAPGPIEPLGASPRPDFARPGRWAVVLLDDGVGAAVLTIDAEGRVVVGESEVGHAGFAPVGAHETALAEALRAGRPHISWESVLTADRHGDGRSIGPQEWAGLAGAFAGDVILATAAWSGTILCGRRIAALRSREAHAAFSARAVAKGNHGRFIEQAACALMPARDPLAGCLAMLKSRVERPSPPVSGRLSPALATG